MPNDIRYKTLKVMIETGNTSSLEDLFNVVPKTVVATDLGINYSRFLSRLNKPSEFTLDELIRLAAYIETDPSNLIKVVLTDIEKKKQAKKRK